MVIFDSIPSVILVILVSIPSVILVVELDYITSKMEPSLAIMEQEQDETRLLLDNGFDYTSAKWC